MATGRSQNSGRAALLRGQAQPADHGQAIGPAARRGLGVRPCPGTDRPGEPGQRIDGPVDRAASRQTQRRNTPASRTASGRAESIHTSVRLVKGATIWRAISSGSSRSASIARSAHALIDRRARSARSARISVEAPLGCQVGTPLGRSSDRHAIRANSVSGEACSQTTSPRPAERLAVLLAQDRAAAQGDHVLVAAGQVGDDGRFQVAKRRLAPVGKDLLDRLAGPLLPAPHRHRATASRAARPAAAATVVLPLPR